MSEWHRVSRARPCPVCGKPDWCIYIGPADSPTAAICARVESGKRAGEAGWLHVLCDSGPTWAPWRRTLRAAIRMMAAQPTAGMAGEVAQAVQWVTDHSEPLERFANELGVSAGSLRRLSVGYSPDRRAWLFPMKSAAGEIIGARLRLASGRKLSIRGGKEGLFTPDGIDGGGRLLITEGPTDAAALLDLGFCAVGRPSCSGGVAHLVGLVRRLKPGQVVIVSDADAPGRKGAAALAQRLRALCGDVRVIEPPTGVKDVRAWKRAGATAADAERLIDAAQPQRLEITSNTRTRKKGSQWKATATA